MKSFIQKRGIIISIFILLVHFTAQYLGEEYKTVEAISKAMLLPSLMLYLAVHPNVSGLPGKNLVLFGLFGSYDETFSFSNDRSANFNANRIQAINNDNKNISYTYEL
jgi:hypothetical protein